MAKFAVLLNIKGLPRFMTRPDSADPMLYDNMRAAYDIGKLKDEQTSTVHGFQVIGWPYVKDDE